MMVCKLELWPGGVEEDVRHLGTIEIINDHETTHRTEGRLGTYDVTPYKEDRTPCARLVISDFPRLSDHSWNLVRQILEAAAQQNGGKI